MPDPLKSPWSKIIPFIPVGDHSVEVEASLWRPLLMTRKLKTHFDQIFQGNQTVRITRTRLKKNRYQNQEQKCLEILMWGYPSGGRGNLHVTFIKRLEQIATSVSEPLPWLDYYWNLHAIGDLGISTVTKLGYFYGHAFDRLPSLILDRRIINIVSSDRWRGLHLPGLNYANAVGRYPEYLRTISAIAKRLNGCNPDQIEFLLFSWGNTF